MESLWNPEEATLFQSDLALRVYTSRLLGKSEDLVLHGGGNTSVKSTEKNIFGESIEVLYVKGSGWDLKTIEPEGFTPVALDHLLKLGKLDHLSDKDMVLELKKATLNPNSPAPSIETILHALIPFKFVDHTHADAVVTLSNTPNGEERIRKLYPKMLVLPFIMPGFDLAKQVYAAIKDINLLNFDGIILLNHGVFTFSNTAKEAYEKMISVVSLAENELKEKGAWKTVKQSHYEDLNPLKIAQLRKLASIKFKKPMLLKWLNDEEAIGFTTLKNLKSCAFKGPITPDHVISTKRIPLLLEGDWQQSLDQYERDYEQYFKKNSSPHHKILDPVPRMALIPGQGVLVIGPDHKRVRVIEDIYSHTMRAIQWGENLAQWHTLDEKTIFELEYWELEQAKLKRSQATPPLEGKVALVTGAASGIGKICVERLLKEGACVVGIDINPEINSLFKGQPFLGLVCDITSSEALQDILKKTVYRFGGLDILVSNAGIFTSSTNIENLDVAVWKKSLEINLTGHFQLLKEAIPYLKLGVSPSVVIMGSKNVPAPGPGASAYSSAKSGLTQLARVAALELGKYGIRVNILHPNSVFDTGIWTPEVLASRAKSYGLTVEEYKTNNILKVEVTSNDVAEMVFQLCSSTFAKTTGAQIPIDGGNDRVI